MTDIDERAEGEETPVGTPRQMAISKSRPAEMAFLQAVSVPRLSTIRAVKVAGPICISR